MASGYVAAAVPLCIVALLLIQLYYLRTSRQLRLLDIEAKAPLFSQFMETVDGLMCIRAYGWSQDYVERNYKVATHSQKPYYLLWCIQRWLTLVLDLLNAGIATLLVAIVTHARNASSSFLGLAFFQIISLGSTLQTLVTEWTQIEMALGAVYRIRSFVSTVENESSPEEEVKVTKGWPQYGAISFKDVTASYSSSSVPVIKQVSFSIKAGEKVAICGRTGRYVHAWQILLEHLD